MAVLLLRLGLGVVGGAAITAVFLSFCVVFAVLFQPRVVVEWVQRAYPEVVFDHSTSRKVVALTIDDGPHISVTPHLMDVLKQYGCRATFFLIGKNMDKWPDLVQRMHREGHELGNHMMADYPSWKLTSTDFERELTAVDDRLEKAAAAFASRGEGRWGGEGEEEEEEEEGKEGKEDGGGVRRNDQVRRCKWFRPGHGWFSRSMIRAAAERGYRIALGSLYPHDSSLRDRGPLIAKYLQWRVYPGAILVLHDGRESRRQVVEVLKRLLPALKARGYEVVTLSELLRT